MGTAGPARLGLGIVGLARHAWQSHLEPLATLPQARLVAACDLETPARDRASAAGLQTYAGYERLLANSAVDAVVICSPDQFHARHLAAAIAAGKHVLCENPLADATADLALVRTALADADRAGLVVSSCHPRRFDPPFTWAAGYLAGDPGYGLPLDVRLDVFCRQPSEQGTQLDLLLGHAGREIDLVGWLFGPSGFDAWRLYDSATRYGIAGQRDDGLSFGLHGSRTLERDVHAELLRIRFERAELTVDSEHGQANLRDFELDREVVFACGRTDDRLRSLSTNENFVDACLGRAASYVGVTDLLVDTEAGIALAERGHYRHEPARTESPVSF